MLPLPDHVLLKKKKEKKKAFKTFTTKTSLVASYLGMWSCDKGMKLNSAVFHKRFITKVHI